MPTKVEHIKEARSHLDISLKDAGKVVRELSKQVYIEDEAELNDMHTDYERTWNQIQRYRRRKKREKRRKRNDKRARTGHTQVKVHYSDGYVRECVFEKPMAEVISDSGVAFWAQSPVFAYQKYTFGNIAGASVLEAHHQWLDGTHIRSIKPNGIEYVALYPIKG